MASFSLLLSPTTGVCGVCADGGGVCVLLRRAVLFGVASLTRRRDIDREVFSGFEDAERPG